MKKISTSTIAIIISICSLLFTIGNSIWTNVKTKDLHRENIGIIIEPGIDYNTLLIQISETNSAIIILSYNYILSNNGYYTVSITNYEIEKLLDNGGNGILIWIKGFHLIMQN
jgi:hypothetical protein